MIQQIVIPYSPNARQDVFHACGADEAVYGGAKGGGKSCGLVMETLAYCLEYPGADAYLFRETYDDLEANLILEWKAKVPKDLYSYNESKHVATLTNGSTVKFRYVKNYQDALRYDGRSIDFIGVDEVTKHEERTIQQLLSCLRSAKGFPPRFRGTCNPGNIGHIWVKKRYVKGTRYGRKMYRDPKAGNVIAFIPAKVYDNDVLMQNDPAYVRRLENLPEARRKALLHGDWDVYDGQAFAEWNYDIHVCRPFRIPAHWYRWRAVDNGYSDPFAWYWFAVSEDGIVYIYREFTRDPERDPKLAYSDQAREVVKRSLMFEGPESDVKLPEAIGFTVVGHEAYNTDPRSEKGKRIVDFYAEGGIAKHQRNNPDKRLRKATWHEYLKPFYDENLERMTAKVQIFETCTQLIETLPQQVEDEDDPEVVAETAYDHWYDGAGFGLVAWHTLRSEGLPPPPPPVGSEAYIEQLAAEKEAERNRYADSDDEELMIDWVV